MASNGKLEGAIHIPAAGWDLEVTDSALTPTTVTVPGGGHRYLSASGDLVDGLIAEIEQQLDATMTDDFTVSMSASGLVTITNEAASTTTITWTDTDLRDVLGFTGNLSGASFYTTSAQARALWLPDSPGNRRNGGLWEGDLETNYMASEADNGSVFAIMTNEKTVVAITWDAVKQSKTWQIDEATTNESFQRFLRDCIYGKAAFGQPSGPIAFFPDETNDAEFIVYRVGSGLEQFKPPQKVANYVGVWTIEIPRMVLVPE